MGPLVAALMFVLLGNTWEKWICMVIVFAGNILAVFSNYWLLFFDKELQSVEDKKDDDKLIEQMGGSFCNKVLATLAVANLVMMFASGMSLRYIPVFFKDLMMQSPALVQIVSFFSLIFAA